MEEGVAWGDGRRGRSPLFFLGPLTGEVRPASVADLLAERCLALGIDLNPENPKVSHPSAGSSVCPGVLYRYSSDGTSTAIRFEGSVDTPEAGVVLPLELRSGGAVLPAPAPTPTSTPTPQEPEPEKLDSSGEPEP